MRILIAVFVLAGLPLLVSSQVLAHQGSLPDLRGELRSGPLEILTRGALSLPAHLTVLSLGERSPAEAGAGVTVALVDHGIDARHPSLAGKLLPTLRLDDGADDDGADDDAAGDDDGTHATALAGLLVATPQAPVPVSGLVRGARILPIQVGTPQAPPDATTLAAGIREGCLRADLVLVALTAHTDSPPLTRTVRAAVEDGCLIIAPAGNQGVHQLPLPASIPGVIAVAGLGPEGLLGGWSNLNTDRITVAAPEQAVTLGPGGGRAEIDGTSAAAAFVAGSLAWVIAERRAAGLEPLTPARARSLLRDTARPLRDPGAEILDFGALDVTALLAASRAGTGPALAVIDVSLAPLVPQPGQDFEARVTVRNRGGAPSPATQIVAKSGEIEVRTELESLAAGETVTRVLRLTALASGGEDPLSFSVGGSGGGSGGASLAVPLAVDAEAKEQVVVTSLRLGATPISGGRPVELTATVENWGARDARGVEVVFQRDDEELGRLEIDSLAVGEGRDVSVLWAPGPLEDVDLEAPDDGRPVSLLAAAAPEGVDLTTDGVLVLDAWVGREGADFLPQYADKSGEAIEFIADAPFYSVGAMGYLPVMAFFPQIDPPRQRRRRPPAAGRSACDSQRVLLSRTFEVRRASPQILGLAVLDLNRLGQRLTSVGPRQLRPAEARRAIDDSTVFALSTRSLPFAVTSDDRPPRLERAEGLVAVGEWGEELADPQLTSRLLCPRETGHVILRIPKPSLLAQTLLESMPAGGVPEALADRRSSPHLQLDVELHLIDNPLAGVARRSQRAVLANRGATASMQQRLVSYLPGREAIRLPRAEAEGGTSRRIRKQLLVQLGDALPLPPSEVVGDVRNDRYVDAHFHTIAEYVGLELALSRRPLAPFKAFGGPLQMVAEAAASTGLVAWSDVPTRNGRPDITPALLRHKVLATDHNVFYSADSDPRYYGEAVPPVLRRQLRAGGERRSELELFRDVFGLGLGEELTLRPFAPLPGVLDALAPSGRAPQDDPHGLSFLDLNLEGPWYGGKALIRAGVNIFSKISNLDAVPDNPNTLRNVFQQATCARQPEADCRRCCRQLSEAEVISDSELRQLCLEQACSRGFRTGREPFLYAAHPFADGFLWNREKFEITDLASGTCAERTLEGAPCSPLREVGRDRSVVSVADDFFFKGAQFWNRRAPLSLARPDLPLRHLQAPYPVIAPVAAFLSAGDGFTPIPFADAGEPGYADLWLEELLVGQDDWMQRNSDGLDFTFEGTADPKDIRLIRKLYAAAGTDAHGDFNYQEDILSTATDVEPIRGFVGTTPGQILGRGLGFDFAHQQLQASNAFAAVRTLLLTADKAAPTSIRSSGEAAEGAAEMDQRAIQALADGNTVLTDGPAIDFSMDADGRFDSAAKRWHSGVNIHENRDGRIGGEGRFDGGRSMLVTNAYTVLDETGSGDLVDASLAAPGFLSWWNDGLSVGLVRGVAATVRPLQVLTPRVHPGPASLTPQVALLDRDGRGYPDVFYAFGWNNPESTGGKPIAVHLYRGNTAHTPSLDSPTRRFTLGEIPGRGVLHREWKVSRFPSQGNTDATDRLSDLSYTYAEALTGSATPRTARHRAISNPVWSIPVDVEIVLEAPLTSAPFGLSATIPACGLRLTYRFPISMKAAAYPVKIQQLDENGDSSGEELAATFLPISRTCQRLDNQGWTPRARPQDDGSIRHTEYTVRNDQPIVVAGPFFPGPANFQGSLGGADDGEPSLDVRRRLLRSFVVYFNAANATSGPLDFHDNPLNTIAVLFSVELVPLAIVPPFLDPDPRWPDGSLGPRLPGDLPGPRLEPGLDRGGTVERPRRDGEPPVEPLRQPERRMLDPEAPPPPPPSSGGN